MTLPCFCCGRQLASAVPTEHDDRNQPSGGTAFSTAGHFGSGAFDPMDGSMLELNVCDECLTARLERVRLLRMARRMETTATPWVPGVVELDRWPASMMQAVDIDVSPDPEGELEVVRFVSVDEAEDEW